MASITVQDLQNIAVQATTDFLNNKCSLNESLAKQASDCGLNSEQLKRAVEATNTLTHLKTLELSHDKTAEFPVADYKSIIKIACIPEGPEKGEDSGEESGFGFFDKKASVNEEFSLQETILPEQRFPYLVKLAAANTRRVEVLTDELGAVSLNFTKKASEFRTNPQAHEHLSASSADKAEYSLLSKALFGEELPRCNYVGGMFKAASLRQVEVLVHMIKEAKAMHSELKERSALKEKADKLVSEMTKSAFLEKTVFKLGRGVTRAATYVPRKIGGAVGNTTASLGRFGAASVRNAAADTALGKGLGIKPTAIDPAIKRRIGRVGAGLAFTGGAIADATMFNHKVDPANDRSGNVWGALQS